VVREEVASLAATERVCLIAFNDNATVVFDGPAAKQDEIDRVLSLLKPEGGTRLADALQRATELALESSDPQVSVVVVTDGLAQEEHSRAAAEVLAARASIIDVILIDPTPKGRPSRGRSRCADA